MQIVGRLGLLISVETQKRHGVHGYSGVLVKTGPQAQVVLEDIPCCRSTARAAGSAIQIPP